MNFPGGKAGNEVLPHFTTTPHLRINILYWYTGMIVKRKMGKLWDFLTKIT